MKISKKILLGALILSGVHWVAHYFAGMYNFNFLGIINLVTLFVFLGYIGVRKFFDKK